MTWMLRQGRTRWSSMLLVLGLVSVIGLFAAGAPAAAAPAETHGSAAVIDAAGRATGPQDFTFQSMHVDYTLGRADDGTSTLRVVETFVAVFPDTNQNRGMRRTIPLNYLGVPNHPTLVSVTDGNGVERASESEETDDALVVTSRAGGYVHGAQTYVFTYDLDNVARFFEDTDVDEFYWNVNGLDWAQPFGEVTAQLTVPSELAPALTGATACYQGSRGSTEACEVSGVQDGGGGASTVSAKAVALAPHQTMTIAVGFVGGTFTPFDASFTASPWALLQGLGALIGFGSLGAAFWMRRTRLRDEPGRPTIIAEYEPPQNIDALESAVLLGLQQRAITAEVLEQAIIGSIRIVEGPPKRWGGSAGFELHLVDPWLADADGRALLNGLFRITGTGADTVAGRTVYQLGKSDSRMSSTASSILSAASKELTRRGLRRAVPAGTRAWPILGAFAGAIVALIAGIAALDWGTDALVPVLAMIVGGGIVVASFGMLGRKPLTAHGAEVRDHLAGLKVFIEWAEADRIRMLQSPRGAERAPVSVDDPRQLVKIYEKLLPFAVVFGQEKEWSKQLAFYYGDEQPGWYYGTSAFNAAAFSSSISSLSASTTSSSSTSGGSSGGGSAGGGGGGGGGGGV